MTRKGEQIRRGVSPQTGSDFEYSEHTAPPDWILRCSRGTRRSQTAALDTVCIRTEGLGGPARDRELVRSASLPGEERSKRWCEREAKREREGEEIGNERGVEEAREDMRREEKRGGGDEAREGLRREGREEAGKGVRREGNEKRQRRV